MIHGRPVISRKVLYQPECRCEFTCKCVYSYVHLHSCVFLIWFFLSSDANFPFDETDLVIKFSSDKWSAEQLTFIWSDRLIKPGKTKSMLLKQGVDASAIGGLGQSEFEIVDVRVEVSQSSFDRWSDIDNHVSLIKCCRSMRRLWRRMWSVCRWGTIAQYFTRSGYAMLD